MALLKALIFTLLTSSVFGLLAKGRGDSPSRQASEEDVSPLFRSSSQGQPEACCFDNGDAPRGCPLRRIGGFLSNNKGKIYGALCVGAAGLAMGALPLEEGFWWKTVTGREAYK